MTFWTINQNYYSYICPLITSHNSEIQYFLRLLLEYFLRFSKFVFFCRINFDKSQRKYIQLR